jgi:hypothetical protein
MCCGLIKIDLLHCLFVTIFSFVPDEISLHTEHYFPHGALEVPRQEKK